LDREVDPPLSFQSIDEKTQEARASDDAQSGFGVSRRAENLAIFDYFDTDEMFEGDLIVRLGCIKRVVHVAETSVIWPKGEAAGKAAG